VQRSASYFLKTARLGFDRWTKDDLPLALALWSDPEVTRFSGGPFTSTQISARLDREITSELRDHVQYWPIFLLDGGDFVGCCGIRVHEPEEKIYELGFHLCRQYWGRGFSTEAGRAVISYAFNVVGANALFAGHHPDNLASKRSLIRLGFQYTHRQIYPPTGLDDDVYLLRRSS
jgi:RimJ/RimL family protein N-acetyltransferase